MARSKYDPAFNLEALNELLYKLETRHEYMVTRQGWDRVHHYTDLGALRGIVESGDLWLTNSRYSNDSDEIRYGYGLVERVIADRRKRASSAVAGVLDEVEAQLDAARDEGAYVTCFCTEADLLSQWRSYGADGTGVCIGFGLTGFEPVAGGDMPPNELGLSRLWPVIYEEDEQKRIVNQCLTFGTASRRVVTAADKARLAVEGIRFFLPTFKDDNFSEERELRLIFTPHPKCAVRPKYRVSGGMLVPYYSLRELADHTYGGGWPLPIESVWLGPSPLRDLNATSVEMLLRQHDHHGVRIEVSATSYRA